MVIYLKNSYSAFIVSALVILTYNNSVFAQDLTKVVPEKKLERAEVQWLEEWPAKANKAKRSFFDIILGRNKQELKRPVSLVVENKNEFWVLDQESNAILQVIKEKAKTPNYIRKMDIVYSSLVGICDFREHEILFTDSYLNKIFFVNSEKKECTVLNDSLKLDKPTGIAYSPLTHEIWVLETGEHRIVVLNEKGEVLKKIGARGNGKGEFNFPTHIWIDKNGIVYIVDAMNFRIQILNKDGEVINVFGSNGDATGYFASPKGIATDSYGNIYVADALFHAVQVFDIKGNFLYTFGSQGQKEGEFWMPSGIFIDNDNKIYVADSYNSRIQVFQLITGGKQ